MHKYLLLCFYAVDTKKAVVKLPTVCMKSVATYLFIFQFITASVIAFNGDTYFLVVAASIIVISFVIYLIMMVRAERIMKKAVEVAEGSPSEALLEARDGVYIHPIELRETPNY